MKRFTAGQVGKGKSIHAVHTTGEHKGITACGKTASSLADGETAVTCKACMNALPSWSVNVSNEDLAPTSPVQDVPAADEIEVEQLWVSTLTGDVHRVVNAMPGRVQLRDLETGRRMWWPRDLVTAGFTYKPEPGAEPFRRAVPLASAS